jgi:hypothetical protein
LPLPDRRGIWRDGKIKPLDESSEDEATLLEGIEVIVKNAAAGDGHTDRVLKLRMWNKVDALRLWGLHRALLIERQQHEHKFTLEQLVAGSLEQPAQTAIDAQLIADESRQLPAATEVAQDRQVATSA